MPTSGWTWDETLYAGSAAYYATGRVPYPVGVRDALRRELRLDGRGRLLDVGCGPGSLTLLLAPLFEEAVGVDADGGMLEAAGRAAATAGVSNTRWCHMRAEDLPGALGQFRVATFASRSTGSIGRGWPAWSSGCWSRPAHGCTCTRRPTRACPATTRSRTRARRGTRSPRWSAATSARSAGPAGASCRGTPASEDEVLRAAGFDGPTQIIVPAGTVRRTEDEVVASVFSLSGSTPHLLGERRAEFERDLRALLRRTSPDGRFAERMREIAIDIWRPMRRDGVD